MGAFRFLKQIVVFGALLLSLPVQAGPVRSFEQLLKMVEDEKVQSVDQLIPLLDDELRGNYSFVVKSRSAMGATYKQPRVNLFNDDASFIIAYAGSPELRDGNAIEIIQSGAFLTRFGKIEFLADGTKKILRPEHAQQCYACHSSSDFRSYQAKLEAHPVWDTYPDWIDRYGSAHKMHEANNFKSGASVAPESAFMENSYRDFLNEAKNNPRYKHLIGLQSKNQFELGDMNSKLGDGIGTNSLKKTAAIMKSNPQFRHYEKSLMSLHRQSGFATELPLSAREHFESSMLKLREPMLQGQEKYYAEKIKRFKSVQFPDRPDQVVTVKKSWEPGEGLVDFDFYSTRDTKLEYRDLLFVLDEMGLSREILNLTFEKASFSITQGITPFGLFNQMLRDAPTLCDGEVLP